MFSTDRQLHILDGSHSAGTNYNQLNCQFLVYLFYTLFLQKQWNHSTYSTCTTRIDLGRDVHSRWGHRQIVREYVVITVILNRFEKILHFPVDAAFYHLMLSSQIGLVRCNPYWLANLARLILSLGRGLLGWNIRAEYLPVGDVKLIKFWHARHYFILAPEKTTRQT